MPPDREMRCAVFLLLACGWSAAAGAPNYDAFSDSDGRIATERHVQAAQEMVLDPQQLEAVYAAAARGEPRAQRVFHELETIHFPNIGREVAERSTRPGCLVPVLRELSGSCIPNWSFLDFLPKDTQAGVRLRKALADAYAARARERGLENQLLLSQVNAVIGVGIAATALRKADLAAPVARAPGPTVAPGATRAGAGASAGISPVPGRVSQGGTTTLYRAVAEAEYEQLMKTGRFSTAPHTLEGKFFAETAADAVKWGQKLQGTGKFRVISVEVPTGVADTFLRWERLDGIGPARYAELDQLTTALVREVR